MDGVEDGPKRQTMGRHALDLLSNVRRFVMLSCVAAVAANAANKCQDNDDRESQEKAGASLRNRARHHKGNECHTRHTLSMCQRC